MALPDDPNDDTHSGQKISDHQSANVLAGQLASAHKTRYKSATTNLTALRRSLLLAVLVQSAFFTRTTPG